MKRILPVITACMMLVIVALSVSASSVTPAYRTPLFMPSPPQSATVPCAESARLATIDYWPMDTDAHYTALFEAQGPGYVFLSTDTEARVSLNLPVGAPQWYSLDLPYTDAAGGVIQLQMGVEAASCAAKGNMGTVIRSLNIFVTP